MIYIKIFGYIYKIENKINGKIYIGQTREIRGFNGRYNCRGEGIERVFNYYKSRIKSKDKYNEHLYNSIKKYGFDNFKVIEVFDVAFSREELDVKERTYIDLYDSTNRNKGYNKKEGGIDGRLDLVYEKMYKGSATPIYCIETNQCFKSLHEAELFYNITISRRMIDNNSPITKNKLHFNYLDNTIQSQSRRRSVICLNNNKIYFSISEVLKEFNKTKTSSISNVCQGKQKYIRINEEQYYFIYSNDYYDKLQYITSKENCDNILKNYEIYLSGYNKMSTIEKKIYFLDSKHQIIKDKITKGEDLKSIKTWLNSLCDFHISEKLLKEYLTNKNK